MERRFPPAQYARMSTDMQEFSIANRSGVSARNRPGLRKLLSDVVSGNPDFKAILVYDVSR